MDRKNHLPEWQQKSLSRLPDRYTADPVPNSKKWEKNRSLGGAEDGDASEHGGIADLDSSGHLRCLWIKLATFADWSGARNAPFAVISDTHYGCFPRPSQFATCLGVKRSGRRWSCGMGRRGRWLVVQAAWGLVQACHGGRLVDVAEILVVFRERQENRGVCSSTGHSPSLRH
jgi:hypothetical protein